MTRINLLDVYKIQEIYKKFSCSNVYFSHHFNLQSTFRLKFFELLTYISGIFEN